MEDILKYEGELCCLFYEDELTRDMFYDRTEFAENYGDVCNGHALHLFDEGGRYLRKCKGCGAWFLIQISEYEAIFSDDGDDTYCSVRQVRDPGHAEALNWEYGGDLPTLYHGPGFGMKDGKISWLTKPGDIDSKYKDPRNRKIRQALLRKNPPWLGDFIDRWTRLAVERAPEWHNNWPAKLTELVFVWEGEEYRLLPGMIGVTDEGYYELLMVDMAKELLEIGCNHVADLGFLD